MSVVADQYKRHSHKSWDRLKDLKSSWEEWTTTIFETKKTLKLTIDTEITNTFLQQFSLYSGVVRRKYYGEQKVMSPGISRLIFWQFFWVFTRNRVVLDENSILCLFSRTSLFAGCFVSGDSQSDRQKWCKQAEHNSSRWEEMQRSGPFKDLSASRHSPHNHHKHWVLFWASAGADIPKQNSSGSRVFCLAGAVNSQAHHRCSLQDGSVLSHGKQVSLSLSNLWISIAFLLRFIPIPKKGDCNTTLFANAQTSTKAQDRPLFLELSCIPEECRDTLCALLFRENKLLILILHPKSG